MSLCVVCSSEIKDDARFCPVCGAEQPKIETAGTDADPLMGKVVAKKFKVEKLLGVGGMGKVYKARQLSLDKAVVVKVLHDHLRDDPSLVQRFQREAKAASRLNHPNSIQIVDFGQDDSGVVFMAMEYLNGGDLYATLKKDGPLPADRVARIMIQVCSALSEAHDMHVIHRDLKPENIMIEDRRGQRDYVKVLDFGIAKIQDPSETGAQALTMAGMVCGTPEYMSPEQARGGSLDNRSDIYSLGVVMYQLSTGELPFTADTPIGIVTKHIIEKPAPPTQKYPHLNINAELEGIILKAMEKEPDKRYLVVSEMGEALERLLEHLNATKSGIGLSPATLPPITPFDNSRPNSTAPTAAEQASGNTGNHQAVNNGGPTQTRPTGDLQRQGANQDLDRPASSGGGAGKMAAIAVGIVVLLGIGGFVVFKDKITGGTPPPAVVKVDPPKDVTPPPVKVQDTATITVVADAGVAATIPTPPPVPTPIPTPVPTPTPVPNKDPKPTPTPTPAPKGDRSGAEAVFLPAHAKFLEGDCSQGNVGDIIKAAQMDKSYGEPMRDIAQCYKKLGNVGAACSAAKEFVARKQQPEAIAKGTLAVFCQ